LRALITGAAGFIGSHLSERLLKQGATVVGIDCFTDSYPRWVKELNLRESLSHPRFSFIEGDLIALDLNSVLDGVECVFHQAAQPGVRSSWGLAFEAYVRNNVLATQRLLEAARGTAIRKFVYASSSSIYGEAEKFPTSESITPRPISPYGVTKLAGEHLCLLYCRRYGVPAVTLRYFTAYGPRQRPDMGFHTFIHAFLSGRPISIYGDGGHSRDFTYVSDVVTANVLAAEKGPAGRVYNIGGGVEVTLNEVIRTLKTLTGADVQIRHQEANAEDPRRTAADTALAIGELGYQPAVGLEEGLKQQIGWVRELIRRQPAGEDENQATGKLGVSRKAHWEAA